MPTFNGRETDSLLCRDTFNKPVLEDGEIRHDHRYLSCDSTKSDPRVWSPLYKWTVVLLLTFMGFSVSFSCLSIVPVSSEIISKLSDTRHGSKYANVLIVTVWELGEAAGPLILGPLSENIGRRPVVNSVNLLFVLSNVLAALSQNLPTYILARLCSGLTVTCNVLNPAIIGDMFAPQHRGSPLSLIMLATFIGGAIGPAFGGIVTEIWGWRWLLTIASALAGTAAMLLLVSFRETYQIRDTARKIQHMQPTIERNTYDSGSRARIGASFARPFAIFRSSGVLMCLSLYSSIAFSNFYNVFTTLPDILETRYDIDPTGAGQVMLSFSAGAAVGIFFCHLTIDRVYTNLCTSRGSCAGRPEFKLPLASVGASMLPFGILLYGWSAELGLPLPVVVFSLFLIGASIMLSVLPLSAYVVDAFKQYSASALTGLIVARSVMCTVAPMQKTQEDLVNLPKDPKLEYVAISAMMDRSLE
ncbi:major facilitator superfamily transporter [Fusarium sporotrichioides]|uniref:Major facilitator superfamily transporter n=1 Tax=Fusarium sporotrichioides TaxID=5514 RepID=A0A395RXZ4_FUSSP|nr:major facilitator superfamily transporter [Fusarium sporotrichioides]